MNPSSIKTNQKIYFFGTCLIDVFYPNAGVSAVTLLERQGVEVLFPQDQSCCGQPAYNSGYRRGVYRGQKTVIPVPATHSYSGSLRVLCRYDETPLSAFVCRSPSGAS